MKNIFFLILGLVLFSCSGRNKVPSGIIKQNEMQSVLWDVIRAQALSEEIARKDSSVKEVVETQMLTKKVFEIHKITPGAFDSSYSWYTGHPEIMRIIFDSMNAQNQRQNDLKPKVESKPFRKNLLNKFKKNEQSFPKR
jgi:hypothetical protein